MGHHHPKQSIIEENSSELTLFQDEEKSIQNLKKLLNISIKFNTHKDPWNQEIMQFNPQTNRPFWFKNFSEEYQCIDKLIIYAMRKKFLKSNENQEFRNIQISKSYMIDLKQNFQFQINDPQKSRQIIIVKEYDKNQDLKQRPQGSLKYNTNPFLVQNDQEQSKQINIQENIIQEKWVYDLGWEFKKINEQKAPSIKQIFDGLMFEMESELRSSQQTEDNIQQIQKVVSNHYQAWKFIFECLGLNIKNNDPIQWQELSQHDSQITKSILFLYSMDTFLYANLNKAERTKDSLKILSLGPFACVLKYISYWAQSKKKTEWDQSTPVFRGVKLPKKIFDVYKEKFLKKEKLELDGFQSTSQDKQIAYGFMFYNLKKDEEAVLFEISNLNQNGLHYFVLEGQDYTVFPSEKEVLLQTGMSFDIHQISEEKNEYGHKYQLIKLTQT